MVSPRSKRSANFANARGPEDNRHGDRKGEKKYNASASENERRKQTVYSNREEPKRLPKLEAHVRQTLAAFRGDVHKNTLPAASTIKKCIAHIENASRDDTEIEVAEFRKCLFALGISPDDTAFLIGHFDKENSGFIDGKMLSNHLLTSASGTRNLQSADDDNNTSGDVKHKLIPGKAAANSANSAAISSSEERAMKELHRKVIERILLKSKTQSIKDAFRQYDLDRTGYLTLLQFRALVRDHGFVGTEVERLIKFLDRANQGTISFHAFSGDVKLGANQVYPKSSPKKQQMAQPLTKNSVPAIASSPVKGKSGPVMLPESQDPMESIRAKLRQRVMGHNKSIREVFMEFDDDGNGYLDYEEFKRFMSKYNFTNDEACQVIDFLDRDFSGTIDYSEFSSGLLFYRPPPAAASTSSLLPASHQVIEPQPTASLSPQNAERVLHDVKQKIAQKMVAAQSNKSSRTRLRDEFMKYDSDSKNGLDYQEFGAFLVGMGIKLKAEELSAVLACIDVNGSEIIEFGEFRKLQDPNFDDDSDVDSSDGPNRDIADTRLKRDEKLLAVFNKYDIDGSGFLDYDEFAELMRDYGFSDADIMHIIKQVDQDKPSVGHKNPRSDKSKGRVDYKTFASVVNKRKWNLHADTLKRDSPSVSNQRTMWMNRVLQKHRSLEEAFRDHDTDGSDELDYDGFRRFMKHYGMKNDGEINALIDQMDCNGDGTVSLQEFIQIFGRAKLKGTTNKQKQDTKMRIASLREQELTWIQQALRENDSIEDAFREYDSNRRGELNYQQFRDLMTRYGISGNDNISLLLKRLDLDNSGTVDLQEFLSVFSAQRLAHQKSANAKKDTQLPNTINSHKRQKAVRLRNLEEAWIRRALENHESIKAVFDRYDQDQSGELDYDEFRQLMNSFGISDRDDIEVLIKRLDANKSGAIDYEEFVTVFYEERVEQNGRRRRSSSMSSLKSAGETKKARVARQRELEVKWMKRVLSCHRSIEVAFSEYDEDGSGELDYDEFSRFMKRYGIVKDEDISSLIKKLDVDDSGAIDYEEFTSVFNPLRVDQYSIGNPLVGMLPVMDEEAFDADELESILEIERELAVRMLQNTRDLRAAFRKYDLNGNGRLEYKEFRQVLRAYRFPELEIRKVIRHLDKHVYGFIDYKEFIAGFSITKENERGSPNGAQKKSKYQVSRASNAGAPSSSKNQKSFYAMQAELSSVTIERLKKDLLTKILATYGTVQTVFHRYDEEQEGRLTEKQFKMLVVDHGISRDDARLLLDAFHQDRSGSIEYEEFLSQLVVRGAV
uniref:EF-hand domain-containing protein n=1 Tax=Globisporangium ultimum (strain ATCC 200006 / CBS 805.95 / DAOM BR144) TaxID=431595 RepID=K3X1F8_GLOUD